MCFIGYSCQTKGYRLIDKKTKKIIVRRDVIFNEFDFDQDTSTVEFEDNDQLKYEEIAVVPER